MQLKIDLLIGKGCCITDVSIQNSNTANLRGIEQHCCWVLYSDRRMMSLPQTDVSLPQTDVSLPQTDVSLPQTDVSLPQTVVMVGVSRRSSTRNISRLWNDVINLLFQKGHALIRIDHSIELLNKMRTNTSIHKQIALSLIWSRKDWSNQVNLNRRPLVTMNTVSPKNG